MKHGKVQKQNLSGEQQTENPKSRKWRSSSGEQPDRVVRDSSSKAPFLKLNKTMAYFSNGSEGMVFDDECGSCKYGKHPCPIALVQMEYNYDQLKDKSGIAGKILDTLVKPNGECAMKETFKHDFLIDPNQTELF